MRMRGGRPVHARRTAAGACTYLEEAVETLLSQADALEETLVLDFGLHVRQRLVEDLLADGKAGGRVERRPRLERGRRERQAESRELHQEGVHAPHIGDVHDVRGEGAHGAEGQHAARAL